jgi:hypothetical protein
MIVPFYVEVNDEDELQQAERALHTVGLAFYEAVPLTDCITLDEVECKLELK